MNETRNLRGYFFGNMYLSQIQQGIQAAHVMQNMFVKYNNFMSNAASRMFTDWCDVDKTMILLNGGAQQDLNNLISKFNLLTGNGETYPVGYFEEERNALNGALTSVGIVLPESVYSGAEIDFISTPSRDAEIYTLISTYKLA